MKISKEKELFVGVGGENKLERKNNKIFVVEFIC